MQILLLLMIGWSITNILVNGSIFDPIRDYLIVKRPLFGKLLDCVTCSGFWVGVILYFLVLYDLEFFGLPFWVSCFFWGFLNSGISVLLNSLVVFLLENNR